MSGGKNCYPESDVLINKYNIHDKELLEKFEIQKVFEKSEVKVWECRNSGHIVVATNAPEVCPVCNHPQAYFEVHAENY